MSRDIDFDFLEAFENSAVRRLIRARNEYVRRQQKTINSIKSAVGRSGFTFLLFSFFSSKAETHRWGWIPWRLTFIGYFSCKIVALKFRVDRRELWTRLYFPGVRQRKPERKGERWGATQERKSCERREAGLDFCRAGTSSCAYRQRYILT